MVVGVGLWAVVLPSAGLWAVVLPSAGLWAVVLPSAIYFYCRAFGSTWRSLVCCLALELRKGNYLSWFGVTWPVKGNFLKLHFISFLFSF